LARTGRQDAQIGEQAGERAAAEAMSEALGGLPLAHEQAAAYCERLELSIADYHKRFAAAPTQMLDTELDAPAEYHDKLTVAKTFALAIEEAAKLHPAAEPLIVHAALLAPEPIPLFLFAEGRQKLRERIRFNRSSRFWWRSSGPFAALLANGGLDEAVAALPFALVDREIIVDERDPAISTNTIRLHRLVREIAAIRREGEAREQVRHALVGALAVVYPGEVYNNPNTWWRARRLDAVALALVGSDSEPPSGAGVSSSYLLDRLASYREVALAAYARARPFYERALGIREKTLGSNHPGTAASLNNLARLLIAEGNLAAARPLCERALVVSEKVLDSDHPSIAAILNNLAQLLKAQGDLAAARPLCERALAIREKALGPEHPDTALSISNLASLLNAEGNLAAARPLFERALVISEGARPRPSQRRGEPQQPRRAA
jgi:tetratricopeptide (TPR) repeat protein